MIWLAIFVPYGVIGVATWRMLTDHFAWHFCEQARRESERYRVVPRTNPTGEQWFGASCLAFTAGVLWPLAAVWALKVPAVGAAAREKVRAQAERIKELERELIG